MLVHDFSLRGLFGNSRFFGSKKVTRVDAGMQDPAVAPKVAPKAAQDRPDLQVEALLQQAKQASRPSARATKWLQLAELYANVAGELSEPTATALVTYLFEPQREAEAIDALKAEAYQVTNDRQYNKFVIKMARLGRTPLLTDSFRKKIYYLTVLAENLCSPAYVAQKDEEYARFLQEAEPLLANVAIKRRVGDVLPPKHLQAIEAQYGASIKDASYLESVCGPRTVLRVGQTAANGGYTKVRFGVNSQGESIVVRVLHLGEQRKTLPATRVGTTDVATVLAEKAALDKARSVANYWQIFAVCEQSSADASAMRWPSYKLYIPMQDLGVDAYFFQHELAADDTRKPAQAAALRHFLRSVNASLLHLHRDEGVQSPPMVHRDIKPENIMVTQDGSINLIDFGLAEKVNALSQEGGYAGSPGFIAPEYVVSHRGHQVDTAIDIWSLAVSALAVFFPESYARTTMMQTWQSWRSEDFVQRLDEAARMQQAWQFRHRIEAKHGQVAAQLLSRDDGEAGKSPERLASDRRLTRLFDRVNAVDPALNKWYFVRLFQVAPAARFTSAELQKALDALPPLFGSPQADEAHARAYFRDRSSAAQAQSERSRGARRPGPQPSALQALPADFQRVNKVA